MFCPVTLRGSFVQAENPCFLRTHAAAAALQAVFAAAFKHVPTIGTSLPDASFLGLPFVNPVEQLSLLTPVA